SPAGEIPRRVETASDESPRRQVGKGSGDRIRLAELRVSPTGRNALSIQSATVKGPRVQVAVGSGGRGRLPAVVFEVVRVTAGGPRPVPPAGDPPGVSKGARVIDAPRDVRETPGGRAGLTVQVVTPADSGTREGDSAGVPVTGADLPEALRDDGRELAIR